jgi:hypothetical protein
MFGWTDDVIASILDGVLTWLSTATMAALNWVLGLLSTTVFTSPDITALPQVAFMSQRALLAANAAMALIVTVVGLLAMTHGTVQERYSLKELLPRMLLGFLLANLSTPVLSTAITGANALTAALTGQRFTSPDAFAQIKRVLAQVASDPQQLLIALVLRELAVWLLVLLVITWLGRLCVLIVVAATAPIALLCHALPQTDTVARTWWRALGACLLVQVLQAVTLHLAVATLLTTDANVAALGLPHDPSGLFNLLMGCFLLWMVIGIPAWVSRTFGGRAGHGAGMLASLARVIVVQQVMAATGLRGGAALKRRTPSPARAGAASRPPASHFHQHRASHVHEHVHLHAPRDGHRAGASSGAARGSDTGTRRPAYWAGDVTPGARSHPGRPPRALEARRGTGSAAVTRGRNPG